MWGTGRTNQIAVEMRRHNLTMPRISEAHWTQAEQLRLDTGEMLLHSDHEEVIAPHTQGVALMLYKEAQNPHVRRESHEFMITKASFKKRMESP
ncbi:unnamed protein product [Schistosoma margrebowiei]|uniref:Uncharacterized protein n=1 Tax=Schistosoma margrebowiei TaxID=48269 RepID=A0A183N631_9TREM|nr:unnamed protein product [Schistosoma margrebowiei]